MQLDLVEVFGPYRKQVEFLTSPSRHRFFCAGRGAGKSWTLTLDVLLRALANPGVPGALLGRTERDLSRNLLPFLRDHLETLRRATGIDYVQRRAFLSQMVSKTYKAHSKHSPISGTAGATMRGRKPRGWRQDLGRGGSYGKRSKRRQQAQLAAQARSVEQEQDAEQDAEQEAPRRSSVGAVIASIYGPAEQA